MFYSIHWTEGTGFSQEDRREEGETFRHLITQREPVSEDIQQLNRRVRIGSRSVLPPIEGGREERRGEERIGE